MKIKWYDILLQIVSTLCILVGLHFVFQNSYIPLIIKKYVEHESGYTSAYEKLEKKFFNKNVELLNKEEELKEVKKKLYSTTIELTKRKKINIDEFVDEIKKYFDKHNRKE